MELDQVLEGDCLELLKTLPDNSVDLICTDPPFYKCKKDWWDRQWSDPEKFIDWMRSLALEWRRVLKPNGSLYVFASTKMAARVEVMLGELFNVVNRITWAKPCPFSEINKGASNSGRVSKESLRGYYPNTESIIFCEHYGADSIAKGEAGYGAKCDELRGFVFEPLRAWLVNEWNKSGLKRSHIDNVAKCSNCTQYWFLERNFQIPTSEKYQILQQLAPGHFLRPYESLRQEYESLRQEYESLRRPFNVSADVPYTDVWTFATVQSYKGKHSCEKPLPMLEHIISASSRPGATVLDCFGGSGNTAIAAKALERNYILMEIDPHWAAVARQKLGESAEFVPETSRAQWLQQKTQTKTTSERQQLSIFDLAAS